jgi:curved DNA-binding protein CbpA
MTDYFAVLQQPRQPWLDPVELKQRYQELTLSEHPDQKKTNDSSSEFAAINEAYRVLKDPKLRLQHLLRLEGHDPSSSQSIPAELLDLFSRIGTFIHATDELLQRFQAAPNALVRSLMQPEIVESRQEVEDIFKKTRELSGQAEAETRRLNDHWGSEPETLAQLYRRFAYLTRWTEQLEERSFRLTNTP